MTRDNLQFLTKECQLDSSESRQSKCQAWATPSQKEQSRNSSSSLENLSKLMKSSQELKQTKLQLTSPRRSQESFKSTSTARATPLTLVPIFTSSIQTQKVARRQPKLLPKQRQPLQHHPKQLLNLQKQLLSLLRRRHHHLL